MGESRCPAHDRRQREGHSRRNDWRRCAPLTRLTKRSSPFSLAALEERQASVEAELLSLNRQPSPPETARRSAPDDRKRFKVSYDDIPKWARDDTAP